MRDIEDLLPELLIYAPDCPELVALRYLRECARELCHNARLWRTTDTMQIKTPICEALITLADAEIVEIEQASIQPTVTPPDPPSQPNELMPVTVGWLDEHHPGWSDPYNAEAAASWITQLNPKTVTIVPRQTGTLALRLILQPSRDALTVPDSLVDIHATMLGKGAAGRVLMLPNADFANPTLGLAYYQEFQSKVAGVKTEATKGQQGARLRTKGDWF